MPVTTDDIKIRASQRLTDETDGGGYMTATEIVDGAINNLHDDISRLDRTIGRVSLRKFFVHVDTADTDAYYGAHAIVSERTADPGVSVVLIEADSDAETRSEAVNRLESYVTLGPRFQGWLWGDQPGGSRQLLVFQAVSSAAPEIGAVVCLFNDKGLQTERSQYVRITDVVTEKQVFTEGSRNVSTIEISDPLEVTFTGVEMHFNDATATSIYTSVVSDASRYYGAMLIRAALTADDTIVMVDSIYAQLVPTSQIETSLVNQTPGGVGPIVACGAPMTPDVIGLSGLQLALGRAIVPGTLVLAIAGIAYTDRGDGVLMQGSNQAGSLDYSTGKITFNAEKSGAVTATFTPGVTMALFPVMIFLPVPLLGRGYNYTAILWPPPWPGTVSVDYMAEAKWYSLHDNGMGVLIPEIEGTGTGTIDYATGHCSLTAAAIPDADTPILIRSGSPSEIVQMAGVIDVEVDPVRRTLATGPVAPGSLTITWPVGIAETGTATDNGAGVITGDATGWIDYGASEIEFTPTLLPFAPESEYTFTYDKYAKQTFQGNGVTFALPTSPKPGTLTLDVPLTIDGWNHTYRLRDDGSGAMTAPGFSVVLSQARKSLADANDFVSGGETGGTGTLYTTEEINDEGFALNESETTTTLTAGGISATVDYVTKVVTIDLSGATAQKITVSSRAQSSTQTSSAINIRGSH